MGRRTGFALLGIGAFLLVAAALLRFYAYDRLAVAPLDQRTTSYSRGPGATIFSVAKGKEVPADLVSTRTVRGDVAASHQAGEDQGRDLAVWETQTYTARAGAQVDLEHPPLSASHDRVVFDRRTGTAVSCCGDFLSATTDPETGEELRDQQTAITGQYFKLPFGAERTTYRFWDGTLRKSTDLVYQRTEQLEGLEVLRYEQVIEPTVVGQLRGVPASLFGVDEPGTITVDRTYSNTRTLWVEPETGVIIKGQEDQLSVASYRGREVATLTDVVIGYDPETVTRNVDTYASLATQLRVVRWWGPLVGLVLGLLSVLAGLALLRGRRPTPAVAAAREPVAAPPPTRTGATVWRRRRGSSGSTARRARSGGARRK